MPNWVESENKYKKYRIIKGTFQACEEKLNLLSNSFEISIIKAEVINDIKNDLVLIIKLNKIYRG